MNPPEVIVFPTPPTGPLNARAVVKILFTMLTFVGGPVVVVFFVKTRAADISNFVIWLLGDPLRSIIALAFALVIAFMIARLLGRADTPEPAPAPCRMGIGIRRRLRPRHRRRAGASVL